jgi:hypothetical protein
MPAASTHSTTAKAAAAGVEMEDRKSTLVTIKGDIPGRVGRVRG